MNVKFRIYRIMSIYKKAVYFILFLAFLIFAAGVQMTSAQSETVVDIVNNSSDHTILADLLKTTELDRIISQKGPFTVIAPTNKAFQDMDADIEQLRNNREQAHEVVLEHLFQGEVTARDAEQALNVKITQGDIRASNGIVHVTDKVIGER